MDHIRARRSTELRAFRSAGKRRSRCERRAYDFRSARNGKFHRRERCGRGERGAQIGQGNLVSPGRTDGEGVLDRDRAIWAGDGVYNIEQIARLRVGGSTQHEVCGREERRPSEP